MSRNPVSDEELFDIAVRWGGKYDMRLAEIGERVMTESRESPLKLMGRLADIINACVDTSTDDEDTDR